MNPDDLWREFMRALRAWASTQVRQLVPQATPAPIGLGDRLLGPIVPPPGNPLVDLVRDIVGELSIDSPVRVHGWRRAPGSPLGIALVLTDSAAPTAFAIVALTPVDGADPLLDVVVTPGQPLRFQHAAGDWTVGATANSPVPWEASFGAGPAPAVPAGATASISVTSTADFHAAIADGPGLRLTGFTFGLTVPGIPTSTTLVLEGVEVSVLPADLGRLIGAKPGDRLASSTQGGERITVTGDPLNGLDSRKAVCACPSRCASLFPDSRAAASRSPSPLTTDCISACSPRSPRDCPACR